MATSRYPWEYFSPGRDKYKKQGQQTEFTEIINAGVRKYNSMTHRMDTATTLEKLTAMTKAYELGTRLFKEGKKKIARLYLAKIEKRRKIWGLFDPMFTDEYGEWVNTPEAKQYRKMSIAGVMVGPVIY